MGGNSGQVLLSQAPSERNALIYGPGLQVLPMLLFKWHLIFVYLSPVKMRNFVSYCCYAHYKLLHRVLLWFDFWHMPCRLADFFLAFGFELR